MRKRLTDGDDVSSSEIDEEFEKHTDSSNSSINTSINTNELHPDYVKSQLDPDGQSKYRLD